MLEIQRHPARVHQLSVLTARLALKALGFRRPNLHFQLAVKLEPLLDEWLRSEARFRRARLPHHN